MQLGCSVLSVGRETIPEVLLESSSVDVLFVLSVVEERWVWVLPERIVGVNMHFLIFDLWFLDIPENVFRDGFKNLISLCFWETFRESFLHILNKAVLLTSLEDWEFLIKVIFEFIESLRWKFLKFVDHFKSEFIHLVFTYFRRFFDVSFQLFELGSQFLFVSENRIKFFVLNFVE